MTALDTTGKPVTYVAEDFHARVVLHESDHLDGVVYLDRVKDRASIRYTVDFRAQCGSPGASDRIASSEAGRALRMQVAAALAFASAPRPIRCSFAQASLRIPVTSQEIRVLGSLVRSVKLLEATP